MPRGKFKKPEKRREKELRELVDQNGSAKDQMSSAFLKLKIGDDGKISLDVYDPPPIQISEDGITNEERQLYGVPDDYMVGETEADGSCFLNSFLIGLHASGQFYNLSMAVLRAICAHIGRETPEWLVHSLLYKYLSNNYSREETPIDFVNRVLYDDSWGEPEIEGRILCKYFSVSVYILEADGKRLVTGEGVTSTADVEFHRPKTLYFINRGRYHYEPLLPVNSNKIPTTTNSGKKLSQKVEDHASKTHGQPSSKSSSTPRTSDQNEEATKLINKKPQQHRNNPSATLNAKSSVSGPMAALPNGGPSTTPIKNVSKSMQDQQQSLDIKDSTSTQPESKEKILLQQLSPTASKSSPVVADLQEIPEFQQLLAAIKAKNILQLKAACINCRTVLHLSAPDLHFIELSLREALLSSDILILDLVYEHWATAAHTSSSHRIYNLKRLNKAMVAARDTCLEVLKDNRQMLVTVHCLIMYNKFRVQLCRELIDIRELSTDSDNMIDKQQQIIDILIVAIDTYIDYGDKNIKSTNFELIDEFVNESFADESNEIYRMYILHNMFELYYCKLDFWIAHLVVKYFDSTELKTKLPKNVLQDIECGFYYYLSRVKDDWRPYVPDKIIKHKSVGFEDFYEFLMNSNRGFNCLAIYLERKKFIEAMVPFRVHLKYGSKITYFQEPAVDVDKIKLLPYLRDKYSLENIVIFLETCSRMMQQSHSQDSLLILQYVLKVIGECLETKANHLRLSTVTEAMLHAHIPRTVFCHLETLREYLSHVSDARLIRRIELEETHPDLILKVAKDIDQIKSAVKKVVELYKPVIEKKIFSKRLSLVNDELLSSSIKDNIIQELLSLDKDELITILKHQNNDSNQLLLKYGLTFKLFEELVILILNTKHLKRELHAKNINAIQNIIKQLPTFIIYMENILNDIELNTTVDDINKNDPNNNNSNILKNDTDFKTLNSLLSFLVNEMIPHTIEDEDEEDFVLILNAVFTASIDKQKTNDVRKTIVALQRGYEMIGKVYEVYKPPKTKEKKAYQYKGIEQLTKLLLNKLFLTKREIEYLKKNINSEFQDSEKSTHSPILDKVFTGKEISIEERDMLLKSIDMNDRCKVIIENLVTGSRRDDCVLQCLAIRVTALKNAIAGIDFMQLVHRYKVDEGFRLLMEALLQDIYNVYSEHGLQHHLDTNMMDIFRWRHVGAGFLDLSNPVLEVINETDSRIATFLRFALNVVEDEPVLKELSQMQDNGLGIAEIKRKWSGPNSPRLQDYFNLLPQKHFDNQTTEELATFDKTNTKTMLSESSKSADGTEPPSMPSTDSIKFVQTSKKSLASSRTTTSCQVVTSISIAPLSAAISSTSAAAQAAVSAASAASTAAKAAASAASAAAAASAALASLITTAYAQSEDNQKQGQL